MAEAMSASAKRRARQKAAAAAAAEAPAAPAPAPAPAPKAEPAAAKSKAKAKAKAAEPAPAPAAPKAEPKAKGKAKAEPKAKATPAPEPKAAAKAEGKAKAKAKGKAKAEPAPAPKKEEENAFIQMDDGTGGEWEVAEKTTQKEKRRQERKVQEAEQKKIEEAERKKQEEQAEIQKKKDEAAAKKALAKQLATPSKAKSVVEVKSTPAPAAAAPAKAGEAKKEEKPEEPDPNVTVVLKVDSSKIGRVIGPKGSNIELIKNKTNVKTVDTQGGDVTIIGLPADVELAKTAVIDLVEKGYMTLSFEDFKQGSVTVNTSALPSIIGQRGAVIQQIKKECSVEINIPQTDPAAKKPPKTTISVAGEAAGVTKAQEIISSLSDHGYHEVTHPGYSHREMKIEESKFRFIIGKGGAEMRHIQNNYKVQVNIPREKPEETPVVITGETEGVDRAVKYIEKILFEADQPKPTREKPEKADDHWGEEAPEEAWMKSYMRKSKQ